MHESYAFSEVYEIRLFFVSQTNHLKQKTEELRSTVREAEAEADKVRKEKTDIVQKWTGAVLNIAKRDEVGNLIFSPKAYFRLLLRSAKKLKGEGAYDDISVSLCTILCTVGYQDVFRGADDQGAGPEGGEGPDLRDEAGDRPVPGAARPPDHGGAEGGAHLLQQEDPDPPDGGAHPYDQGGHGEGLQGQAGHAQDAGGDHGGGQSGRQGHKGGASEGAGPGRGDKGAGGAGAPPPQGEGHGGEERGVHRQVKEKKKKNLQQK